ncbi:hypothetical protein BG006_003688, partial [Podila minutissima]
MKKPASSSKASSTPKKTAVLFLGNSGAGKSTLLTQLGAKTFPSGVRFRKGVTKDVYEEEIMLGGKKVLLIDVPGLYEPNENETEFNAKKLSDALSRGYDYKLYFVMKADNRGTPNHDLVMMSKINRRIKKVDGARISFRIIINQITGKNMHDMYEEEVGKDNFESLFKTLNESMEIPGFSFDIKIDSVMLLMYSEEDVKNRGFAVKIAEDVCQHSQVQIDMDADLKASNEDLTLFDAAAKTFLVGAPMIAAGGLAAGVVGGLEAGVMAGCAAATAGVAASGLAVGAVGGSL